MIGWPAAEVYHQWKSGEKLPGQRKRVNKLPLRRRGSWFIKFSRLIILLALGVVWQDQA
jgi:hypothetical protein